MKKIIFSLFAVIFSIAVINSQTLVTTIPQCKNAILEEYTGIHCGYCPDGHRIAELIRKANPTQVVLINIHQGSFANPTIAGDPDFRTIYGDSLASQAGVTGYPNGTINRHIFPKLSSTTAMNRGAWNEAATEIMGIQSPVNIGFTSTFDSASRELTINVELYYTLNSPSNINYINVAFLENHVIGYQSDYANGNHTDYDHKHIMRNLITGQWGDKITQTTKGSLVTKTYNYTVPSTYKIENCDVVVYVTESHKEIYTGVQATAIGGSNNGAVNTYIGELNLSGLSFKQSQPTQASTFNITAQSAFISAQDFILNLTSDAPSSWTGTFIVDGIPYTDSALISFSGSASKSIIITAIPGSTPGLATYVLTMKSASNPTARIKKNEVNVISGITDLIVSNDASWGNSGDTSAKTYQQVFKDGLQFAGISSYTATSLSIYEKGFVSNALQGIKNLYYNVGWSFPSLTDSNVAKFQSFLDKGGNLLISGQDIGWETFDTTTSTFATPNTKSFFTNYLKASWTNDGSTSQNIISAIPGESVFSNTGSSSIVNVYGNNPADGKPFMYPDIVYPVSIAQPIFYYNNDPTKVAGVRSNNGVYKTAYLAVSLEMIASTSLRNKIMKLAYDWFNGDITSIDYDKKMQDMMGQNYPNPATKYTTIPLKNIDRQMQLNLTDINGKVLQTIQIEKGSKSVMINCNELKSGVYICRLVDKNMTIGTSRIVISE